MNKIFKLLFFIISILLFLYVLPPSPDFPAIPPQSVQSKEPADTETPLRRAYFTNLNRQEVIEYYEREFNYKKEFNKDFKYFSPRLNYPPEEAQTIIRDQTRSTYLEEIVHPLRESLYINGFEPKTEKDTIIIDGVNWKQKIIVKYSPSSIYLRLIVVALTVVSTILLVREYKNAKNE